jgi:hypothetical protein
MRELNEYRKLLRIKVDCQGECQFYFRVVNTPGYKDYTLRGSPAGLHKFLKRIKAKDTKTNPNSLRGITYQEMLDDIISGQNPEIWVWSYMWKPMAISRKIVNLPESVSSYIFKRAGKETLEKDMGRGEIWKQEAMVYKNSCFKVYITKLNANYYATLKTHKNNTIYEFTNYPIKAKELLIKLSELSEEFSLPPDLEFFLKKDKSIGERIINRIYEINRLVKK